MRYFTILFFIIGIASTYANNKVLGRICDANGSPIDYATVSLFLLEDSTFFKSSFTDSSGKFSFKNIPNNHYLIRYSCLGYSSKCDSIYLSTNIELDTVYLNIESTMLKEVVVNAKRPEIKRNATGIVVSVNNIKYLQNKTLDKILSLSPGIFLDNNGNISINGNSGVSLIFNDRTIRLTGEQLISYLKNIQGKDIKNIEIMTNPTSAYDAEGTGGVIKITTQKNADIGLSGFISSNFDYDKRCTFTPSTGLAYSLKNITIYGNYHYSNFRDVIKRYTIDKYLEGESHMLSEIYFGSGSSNNYTIGIDYDINDNHYLGFEYNGMTRNVSDKGNLTTESNFYDTYKGKIYTLNNSTYHRENNLFNINYVWRIDSLGQVLKLVTDYSDITGRDDIDDYNNKYYNAEDILVDSLYKRQISKEGAEIYSIKIDYEKLLKRGIWKLNAGLKYSKIKNTYSYNMLTWENNDEIPQEDLRVKDRFKYTENVYAGYINAYFKSKKLESNIGIRGEYERCLSFSFSSNKENERSDFHIFPSAFLYWKPCETSGFMAYYGMRIRRPSYQLVNPFVCYISDYSYKVGNPDLMSEIVNSIELTYVLKNKYYMSLRSEFRTNRISDYSYTDGKYIITSTTNLNSYSKYYFNAYIPLSFSIWSSNIMLNIGFLNTGTESVNGYKTFDMNISWDNYLNFSDAFGLQARVYYTPPYKDVYISSNKHKLKVDINLDYSFLKDKWLFTFGIDDIFNTMRQNIIEGNYPSLTERVMTDGISPGRTFHIGLKFNFSTKKTVNRKHKDISNSEELNRL